MAELHEGGNPEEYMKANGQKLEEQKQQINQTKQRSNKTGQGIPMAPVVFIFSFLFSVGMCPFIAIETNRSKGVVKDRDEKKLFVQDLKDTAVYYQFEHDADLGVDLHRAFPHVVSGDTLTYLLPARNTARFDAVRKVNGQSMSEFAKKRQQIAESAKIRNSLNQKTK